VRMEIRLIEFDGGTQAALTSADQRNASCRSATSRGEVTSEGNERGESGPWSKMYVLCRRTVPASLVVDDDKFLVVCSMATLIDEP
jgi:hypothetical protein